MEVLDNIENLNSLINNFQCNRLLISYKNNTKIDNFYTNNITNKYNFDIKLDEYKAKYFEIKDKYLEIRDIDQIIFDIFPFNDKTILIKYIQKND